VGGAEGGEIGLFQKCPENLELRRQGHVFPVGLEEPIHQALILMACGGLDAMLIELKSGFGYGSPDHGRIIPDSRFA